MAEIYNHFEVSPDALAVVRYAYADFARGDIPRVAQTFATDARIMCHTPRSDMFPFGGEWRGRDGLIEYIETVFATFEHESFHPLRVDGHDAMVVAHVCLETRYRRTGKRTVVPVVQMSLVKDGEIVEFHEFFDAAKVAREVA